MNDADRKLAAFADGELEGDQNLEMLRQMAKAPSVAQRVEEHQKLRAAVGKAMDDPSVKAPDSLRDQIMQMAATEPAESREQPRSEGSPVLAVIGRWVPAAVAAVLLLGAVIALNQTGGDTVNDRLITSGQVLNASLVERFGTRHFKCARKITPIYGSDQFPQKLDELPGALSSYFHQSVDVDALNLSSLGYEFDMIGLCILPGEGSVHMIYSSQAPTGQADTLSLWLRPFEEGSGIETGKLYKTPDPQKNFPMLVWRTGDMVFYLVGDSYDAVERAFDVISRKQG